MNVLLQVDRLTKSYGDRMLFDSVTFGVAEGDKIGIVAKNGTGKSTLLSIIAGDEAADSGSVIPRNDLRVAFMRQKPVFPGNPSVARAALMGAGLVAAVVLDYEEALASGDADTIHAVSASCSPNSAWTTPPPGSTPFPAASASVWPSPPAS